MGKLLIDSVYQLDRPVVVAYVLLATLLFVTVNFLVDILYAALDPRVKLTGRWREHRSESSLRAGRCRHAAARQGAARIRSRPTTARPAILLGVMVALAVLAPFITPQNPHDLASLSVMDNRLPPARPA